MAKAKPPPRKSSSMKQARMMAAVAHSRGFAKKVGIPMSVGKRFNQADTGTKMLSMAMRGKRKKKGK